MAHNEKIEDAKMESTLTGVCVEVTQVTSVSDNARVEICIFWNSVSSGHNRGVYSAYYIYNILL